jgi:type II secretion system-associated lipoprotein
MREIIRIVSVIFLFAGVSCSSVILPEDELVLKEIEKGEYTLLVDVSNNGEVVLPKGTAVKLYLRSAYTYVKVYASRADGDPLVVTRYLVLYMFDDEFKTKMFTREEFDVKFNKYLAKGRVSVTSDSKQKKKGSGK